MRAALILVWHAGAATVELGEPTRQLADGLFLVRSERSLSRVYHAVKRQLPEGTPLLAAPLADAPKFRGLLPGALRWVRAGT